MGQRGGSVDRSYLIITPKSTLDGTVIPLALGNLSTAHYQISEIPSNPEDPMTYPACAAIEIDMGLEVDPITLEERPLDWTLDKSSALAGHLDGHGSTLKNLTVKAGYSNSSKVWNAGLLYSLAPGSEVKNLTITGAAITQASPGEGGAHAAGFLAARAGGGTVSNFSVQGSISVSRNVNSGGLIGVAAVTGSLSLSNILSDTTIGSSGKNGGNTVG